jgi:hypothetical protein
MLRRRRGTTFVAIGVALAAIAIAGCGRDDFENNPRPPIALEATMSISDDGVAVSPRKFGAGLTSFTIANVTDRALTLAIDGPVNATSGEIPARSSDSFKVTLTEGNYEATVNSADIAPGLFEVGPERPPSNNDLLLP